MENSVTIPKETQKSKRPAMPQDIETKVLTLSRRRCVYVRRAHVYKRPEM